MTALSLRLARRELRGSLRGFGVFVACLALGVAAIAAAGSLDAALKRTLAEDLRALLGGDAELRLSHRPLGADEAQFLGHFGILSNLTELRAMARVDGDGRQTLVEVKAIDDRYPLYGTLALEPAQSAAAALARREDGWGAAVDANLLDHWGFGWGSGADRQCPGHVARHHPERTGSGGHRLFLRSAPAARCRRPGRDRFAAAGQPDPLRGLDPPGSGGHGGSLQAGGGSAFSRGRLAVPRCRRRGARGDPLP